MDTVVESRREGEWSESSLSILGSPEADGAGRESRGSRGDQSVRGRNVPGQASSVSSGAAGTNSKLA